MASRGDIKFEEVQPELSKNWLRLGFEETLCKAGSFTKLKSKDYFSEGLYPVIDQGDSFISGFINDEKLLYQGELPVVIFGDHTRVVKFIDFQFATGADGTKVLKPLEVFDDMFYFYYLKTLKVPSLGYSRHFKILKAVEVPLPPLAEQQRIVAKLDTLFGHLDSLKTRLETIPQLLKNFRQAVLTQAVTGKLTEEWREGKELEDVNTLVKQFLVELAKKEKSLTKKKKIEALINEKYSEQFKIPNEWAFFKLDKLCLGFTYGSSSKSQDEGLVPVLRMGNLQDGKIDWNNLKYSVDKKEIEKYMLTEGDVLFNRTNSPELVGKTSLYSGEQKALYAGYLIKIKTSKVLNSSYLNYALNSPYAKEWCWKVKTDGVSQSNINAQKLSQFNLPFPSKEEQTEIVKRVKHLFTKADKIEAQYQSLKAKIHSLPQAILAKAFKGELVEQLDTDGDAKNLLEEIKKLKAEVIKKGKKRK